MDLSQSHVNTNISLAQFEFKYVKCHLGKPLNHKRSQIYNFFNRVTLADTYSTDYYDTSYPGLIMKVDTKYSIQTSHDKYSHLIV